MPLNNKKHKLLIVEDEISLREILCAKFTKEGYIVFSARDGEIGLESAIKNMPDLILLDMVMPKMDGATMLVHLREKQGSNKVVPVIILTNLGDKDCKTKTISKDVNVFYLVKSDWALGNLVMKVKEILSRKI
jgi:DNA-binding response OmpR family regulator